MLKQGTTEILVCTNVAARGIDIKNVAHVILKYRPTRLSYDCKEYFAREIKNK